MHTARVRFRVLDNLVRYRYQGISERFAMPSHRGRQQAQCRKLSESRCYIFPVLGSWLFSKLDLFLLSARPRCLIQIALDNIAVRLAFRSCVYMCRGRGAPASSFIKIAAAPRDSEETSSLPLKITDRRNNAGVALMILLAGFHPVMRREAADEPLMKA